MCGTAEPGAASFERVACSVGRTLAGRLDRGPPGSGVPHRRRCGVADGGDLSLGGTRQADDPLDFTWSEERPTQEQWDSGQRYGICWVPV